MKTFALFIALIALTVARANAQCDFVLVGTTDFSTGSTSSFDIDDKTATINLEAIHSDAALRVFGGLVYVVNRAGADNIQVLDPCDNFDTVFQFSTGNGSGPHDVVVLSPTVAYVTRYDMTTLLKVNPQTGATITTINLASFADADGIPEMDQMFVYGDRLYVAVQRLDRPNFYSPTDHSTLAVIDITTDTLVDMDPGAGGTQGIMLVRKNPYSEVGYRTVGGVPTAYFSAVEFFGLADAGVIECDLTDPTSQTVILTEASAGGDVLDVEIISDTKGFAIIATPSFTTELIAFNPTTGLKIGSTLYAPGGYDLNDCEPSSIGLLLGDRKFTAPGIRCFDMTTNAQIPGGPVDVGLPPFDIVVDDGSPTDVGNSPLATRLGANYPNPFNPETSIPFSLASAGRVTLRIYDVSGEFVATLLDENRDPGEHVARWDGRDARGRASSSGVYFARLEAAGVSDVRKLVLLK